ncbi:MAG: hypothetical protein ACI8VW_002701, partial [bacterium]
MEALTLGLWLARLVVLDVLTEYQEYLCTGT